MAPDGCFSILSRLREGRALRSYVTCNATYERFLTVDSVTDVNRRAIVITRFR